MFGGIDSSSSDGYTDVPLIIQAFFQAFRTQIGDIQITNYGHWDEDAKQQDPVSYYIAITIIWFFWFFNIVIMQIMMLNIVIAQVGQIFDRVISRGEGQVHQELAILNFKIFQIRQLLNPNENYFDALIIQRPLLTSTESESEKNLSTLTGRIKKNVQVLLNKQQSILQEEISTLKSELKNEISQVRFDYYSVKHDIGNLKTQMKEENQEIKQQLEKIFNQMSKSMENKQV